MDAPRPSPTLALLLRARAAELELARVFDPHGLTVRKHGVLRAIAATPGLSPRELARRANIDVHGVATLVRALVDAGLVRQREPRSVHTPFYATTERGDRALARIDAELQRLDVELFAGEDGGALASALLVDAQTPEREPQD
ncbi:MarR family transcriptional regulator [Schumannella sp. 10F1B-5-1]|uniref:MarR family transcriptional regulator n=1 Tax=Schumannella sp. 10F1B-5-1 TaxID=2590780 RepID=UPI0015E84EA9|nr:MarR family transcriptional regulator [Schumannella sp. 10F1B-5-1]